MTRRDRSATAPGSSGEARERPPQPWLACRGCGYDLTGIPDGSCPECGRGFTGAGLHDAWLRRRQRRPWWQRQTAAALGAGMLGVPAAVAMSDALAAWRPVRASAEAGLIALTLYGVLWTITLAWAVAARRDRLRWHEGVWLLVPASMTAAPALSSMYWSPRAAAVAACGAALLAAALATAQRRGAWPAAAVIGGGAALAVAGIATATAAWGWTAQGLYWSKWPAMTLHDVPAPRFARTTALHTLQAGLALAAAGVAAALAGWGAQTLRAKRRLIRSDAPT